MPPRETSSILRRRWTRTRAGGGKSGRLEAEILVLSRADEVGQGKMVAGGELHFAVADTEQL